MFGGNVGSQMRFCIGRIGEGRGHAKNLRQDGLPVQGRRGQKDHCSVDLISSHIVDSLRYYIIS